MSRNGAMAMPRCRCPTAWSRSRPPNMSARPTGLAIRPLGFPDSYAPVVGHVDGWPVAYDPARSMAWLTHCYASVGVGRDLAPDTGTGGELYAVIGHSPRPLDRNIANVGRVIEGIALLSARPRGTGNLGFYQADRGETPIPIARIRLAADMPEAERPRFEVMRSDTPTFTAYVTGRANRGGDFFRVPPGRGGRLQRQRAGAAEARALKPIPPAGLPAWARRSPAPLPRLAAAR